MDRTSFNTEPAKKKEFNKLINAKPKVKIKGEDDFGSNSLNLIGKEKEKKVDLNTNPLKNLQKVTKAASSAKKRGKGRPVQIKDDRFKANQPKVISKALSSKLNVLEDYVDELSLIEGKVSFDKYIDTLVEVYISLKLNADKQEHLRKEIEDAFNRIK